MLSIITPTYNSENTLAEAYRSILDSGIKNAEIIFVDDGSTDSTVDVIRKFQAANQDVVLLQNESNQGGGVSRNRGVRCAKNDLVFILDSDDVLFPGALRSAINELNNADADGLATSKSVFFSSEVENPSKTIKYKSGYISFEGLVSHAPNPVIGNLLFRKQAFIDVGGYPTHHSFDTQGFGFRLIQNNKKILIGNTFMYYQRIPCNPSYYVREARAGNVNRNWFYIFYECLYKFSPPVRRFILEFPYADASLLAKGEHLFNCLANQSSQSDFYSSESINLDEHSAYKRYSVADDVFLSAWCFGYELRNQHYNEAFPRLEKLKSTEYSFRLIYPLISNLFGSKMSEDEMNEFSYFFSQRKSLHWRTSLLRQKILNRMKRYLKYV